MAKKKRKSLIGRLINLVVLVFILLFAYYLITGNDFGLISEDGDSITLFEDGENSVFEIIISEEVITFDGDIVTIDELEDEISKLKDVTIKLTDDGATNKVYNDVVDLLNEYNIVH